MMQLKRLVLSGNIARSFYRSYVSSVSVNVATLNSIRIEPKDFFDSSSDEVKLTIFDSNKNKVEARDVESLRIVSTTDAFEMKCSEASDLSVLIQLPHCSFKSGVGVDVKAESSSIDIESLPTKKIDLRVKSGNITMNSVQGDSIVVNTDAGDITAKGILLAKLIQLTSKDGKIFIGKSQGDELEVEAKSIQINCCYSKASKFHSTSDAFLKNVHSDATIKSSGSSFKLSGFNGTIKAEIDNENVEIQLSELIGESELISSHQNATVKLGLAEGLTKFTNINISSSAPMESYIEDLMVYHKSKSKLYEVERMNSHSKNRLNFLVKGGKSVELYTMSWIDFLKFV